MDRIDIHLEVPRLEVEELNNYKQGEKSSQIRKRVERAREIQKKRFEGEGISQNSQMTPSLIEKYILLDKEARELLEKAISTLNLSARAYDRILKLARTIGDLAGKDIIGSQEIGEAIQYRSLDRKLSL